MLVVLTHNVAKDSALYESTIDHAIGSEALTVIPLDTSGPFPVIEELPVASAVIIITTTITPPTAHAAGLALGAGRPLSFICTETSQTFSAPWFLTLDPSSPDSLRSARTHIRATKNTAPSRPLAAASVVDSSNALEAVLQRLAGTSSPSSQDYATVRKERGGPREAFQYAIQLKNTSVAQQAFAELIATDPQAIESNAHCAGLLGSLGLKAGYDYLVSQNCLNAFANFNSSTQRQVVVGIVQAAARHRMFGEAIPILDGLLEPLLSASQLKDPSFFENQRSIIAAHADNFSKARSHLEQAIKLAQSAQTVHAAYYYNLCKIIMEEKSPPDRSAILKHVDAFMAMPRQYTTRKSTDVDEDHLILAYQQYRRYGRNDDAQRAKAELEKHYPDDFATLTDEDNDD